jgi:hypothetical protein
MRLTVAPGNKNEFREGGRVVVHRLAASQADITIQADGPRQFVVAFREKFRAASRPASYLDESGSCRSHGPVSPSLPKTHFFCGTEARLRVGRCQPSEFER